MPACRSLFATHYHQLSDDFKDNPAVALKHMACHVQAAEDGPEQVRLSIRLLESKGQL